MTAADTPDQDGTTDGLARLAEEVRLLVEMVVEHALPWLEEALAAGHGAAADEAGQAGEHSAGTDGGSCQWCPLCAVVAMAAGHSPELVVRLSDQAAQVVALLRAVLADRWQPDDGVHMPGFRPDQQTAPERPSGRVQHIAVRRGAAWNTGTS